MGMSAPWVRLSEIYSSIAKRDEELAALVGENLGSVLRAEGTAKGAAQVSQVANQAQVRFAALSLFQNQILIEQNKRVIALLEQLTGKKGPRDR